jgi:para-nitrobenzyl esterase
MRKSALTLCLSAFLAQGASAAPIAEATVSQGTLHGVASGQGTKFLGVPFAAPPVGDLRWKEAQPAASWSGVRAADKFSPACFQKVTKTIVSVSEDCLYLNVWTPAQSKNDKLPVLFWVLGGGYQNGSAGNPLYDGEALAKKGIIVVNFNFRVGAIGFLAHPALTAEAPYHSSGNYGMLDVVTALKWIKANIAAFGGDPNAITVAGQSSGGSQIKILDVSPLTRGMYARAIVQSGPRIGSAGPTLKDGEEQGVRFAKKLDANSLADLRAIPPDRLLAATGDETEFRFAPIFEPYVQPAATIDLIRRGEFNKTPLITGLTAEEQSGNNPKADKMTARECADYVDQQAGDWGPRLRQAYMNPPSRDCFDDIRAMGRERNLATTYTYSAMRQSKSSQPIYTYIFQHPQPGPDSDRMRTFHGGELVYEFGTLDKVPPRPFTQQDRDISETFINYIANFVKSGNPNGPGLPQWTRFDPKKPVTMELGDKFATYPVYNGKRGKLMQEYLDTAGPKTLAEGHLPFSR